MRIGSPTISAHQVLLNPDYYLYGINLEASALEFFKVNAEEFRASSFMDKRLNLQATDRVLVDIAEARAVREQYLRSHPGRMLNYLFHTAFCGSTLLAKCLDRPRHCITFREPQVLMQLANLKRSRQAVPAPAVNFPELLELVLFFLACSANDGENVVFKPMNSANNLLDDILASPGTGGVVLLYSDLENFLLAILRGGEVRRGFARRLFQLVRSDTPQFANLPLSEVAALTDLQMAVLVWQVHMEQYRAALARHPRMDVKTLDCKTFYSEPEETLVRLGQQFGCALDRQAAKTITQGPLFRTHSKDSHLAYDAAQRATQDDELRTAHQEDLRALLAWSEHLRPDGLLRLPLPNRL